LKEMKRNLKTTDYDKLYLKLNKILGSKTPLKTDCGVLCGCACCKGDDSIGMLLFPGEKTELTVTFTQSGERLAVCNGHCNRDKRPLACRIFPFFPTVDDRGRVFIEKDLRANRLCPLLSHSDEIVFDRKFFKAFKKVGKLLAKDTECRKFLEKSTAEIDLYGKFYGKI